MNELMFTGTVDCAGKYLVWFLILWFFYYWFFCLLVICSLVMRVSSYLLCSFEMSSVLCMV